MDSKSKTATRPVVVQKARASTVGIEFTNNAYYPYTTDTAKVFLTDTDYDNDENTSPSSPNQRVSKLFQSPKLDLQIRDNQRVDLRLNSIARGYTTTLGKLTADANERLAVVKDTDILRSEATAEEVVALQMLEQWQKAKARREHKTQCLLTALQDKISRCVIAEDDGNRVHHHQLKENQWTEFTVTEFETKYFRKRVHSKKTCLQIDAKPAVSNGAKLSIFVSLDHEAPSQSQCHWKWHEAGTQCRVVVTEMDPKFVSDHTYFIAVRAESSKLSISKIKVKISAIAQSKKSRESGRSLKGIRSRLDGRLKSIRSSEDSMMTFQRRLVQIKQRHHHHDGDRLKLREKIKLNASLAGDLLWSSHRSELHRGGGTEWTENEDAMLMELVDRFKAGGGAKKWDVMAMMMKNAANGRRSGRDCNERAAILQRREYTKKEREQMEHALSTKRAMEEEKLRECELKIESLAIKDEERKQRQLHVQRQRQLQPLQRRWLVLLETMKRMEFLGEKLSAHRQCQREMRLKIRACVVIQQFVRKKMEREREWKGHLHANMLRSVLRLCVANREMNKYHRAAAIIVHFVESNSSSFSPLQSVISNFRNSVCTIQRFARSLCSKKKCRIKMFRSQMDSHLLQMIKLCDGNAHKERRFRFTQSALDRAMEEYHAQKSREHKRRLTVWLKEIKMHREGRTTNHILQRMLGDQRKIILGDSKPPKSFLPKRPKFRIKISNDELDGLVLKIEKFQKQQQRS